MGFIVFLIIVAGAILLFRAIGSKTPVATIKDDIGGVATKTAQTVGKLGATLQKTAIEAKQSYLANKTATRPRIESTESRAARYEAIRQLKELLDRGAITETEFNKEKINLLGGEASATHDDTSEADPIEHDASLRSADLCAWILMEMIKENNSGALPARILNDLSWNRDFLGTLYGIVESVAIRIEESGEKNFFALVLVVWGGAESTISEDSQRIVDYFSTEAHHGVLIASIEKAKSEMHSVANDVEMVATIMKVMHPYISDDQSSE